MIQKKTEGFVASRPTLKETLKEVIFESSVEESELGENEEISF